MRYLLDTHVWLWMLMDSPRLGPVTRERLASPDAQRVVSAVSYAEVAKKHALGKLPLPCSVEHLKMLGRFESASFDVDSAHQLVYLPNIHKDPFDRMLVAQAKSSGMVLVSADEKVRQYSASTLDPTH